MSYDTYLKKKNSLQTFDTTGGVCSSSTIQIAAFASMPTLPDYLRVF